MVKRLDSNITITNLKLKFLFSVFLFSPLVINRSNGQIVQSNDDLNLSDSGRKIENTISLYTSRINYKNIKNTTGTKVNLKTTTLIINGDTLVPEKISTRGQTSLYYKRKSYSFSLESKASFCHREKTESFKKFFALNLAMDRDYICNRMAFEMLENIHLFDLFYSFCELRINDLSEGIYMVLERPEDWAMKKKNSPLIIRRGYNENIDKTETKISMGKGELKTYKSYFRQIYSSLTKYNGEELYKALSKWIDLDAYMKWLAFNFFVRNRDYTDEVYLYIDPNINKLNIIPWDYDDLFSRAPHEGSLESQRLIGDKLIFSAEDLLDQKIANDPFLYKIYLSRFKELVDQLSPAVIKKIFEETYAELYPYYSDDEIINMSGYDLYLNTNLEKLKSDMITFYKQLMFSRDLYLKYIKDKI